jgi:hypothetical protein
VPAARVDELPRRAPARAPAARRRGAGAAVGAGAGERARILCPTTRCWIDEPGAGHERLSAYWEEALAHRDAAREGGRVAPELDDVLLALTRCALALAARRPVVLDRSASTLSASAARFAVRAFGHDELRAALVRARSHERALEPLLDRLAAWREEDWRIVLAAPSLSGAERLRALLAEYGVKCSLARAAASSLVARGHVEVRVAALSEGLSCRSSGWPWCGGDSGRASRRRARAGRTPPTEALAQLRPATCWSTPSTGSGSTAGWSSCRSRCL